MDKVLSVNQKRANKHQKSKKKQPLKVVYITNPIKFKASASEFRALVQEFTGQDADTPETARPAVAEGGSGGANAADGLSYVHAEIGQSASSGEAQAVMQNGSDPSSFGSTRDDCDDDDVFSNLWNEAAHLDLLKSLGAMFLRALGNWRYADELAEEIQRFQLLCRELLGLIGRFVNVNSFNFENYVIRLISPRVPFSSSSSFEKASSITSQLTILRV